jgi:hypothetical protein
MGKKVQFKFTNYSIFYFILSNLEGVETDLINNVKLKQCECIDAKGNCTKCRHDWTKHMHITYENEVIEKTVMDANVKKMIDAKKDTKLIVEASIKSIDDLVRKLKNEQGELIRASAKFANFTRHNAIAVFNDDLDAYLELLIKEEISKKQAGATNQQVIDGKNRIRNFFILFYLYIHSSCRYRPGKCS